MTAALLRHRRACVELIHALLAAAALAASFWLRFEFTLPAPYPRMLEISLPVLLAAKLAVFRGFGLRDLSWRYFGFPDLLRIAGANMAAAAAATIALRLAAGSRFPRSIHVLDLLLATTLLASAHAAAKLWFDRRGEPAPGRRAAIYGAGRAGAALLHQLRADRRSGFQVVCFFDDDPGKRDLRIQGVRVLGGVRELAAVLRARRIESLLLALPEAGGDTLSRIVAECRRTQTRVQRAQSSAGLGGAAPKVRDLRLEDLLNRRPLEIDTRRLAARLAGSVALVTGAGGSIGSELCRHLARLEPAALVGLDHSENALFEIDREMRARFPHLRFHAELGSIRDPLRLGEIFSRHRPGTVYHAAAYKHVPMMEAHLFEAVENNVFGTRNVARAAAEAGVADFVLISSDKAVRPANVMGATKRLAERIVQASPPEGMRAMAVRFGNVLGSSGSVVPLFQSQIAAGGPILVTHPEMRRFFMTIPEAAQLVLEAAALGRGGEIFVLEMGEAVGIADLARKMILLSGLKPEEVRIEYTGVRPGEKLREELSAYEEDTLATRHPQIRILEGKRISGAGLAAGLDALRQAVARQDPGGVVLCLRQLVPDYNPSGFVLERAVAARGAYV